MGQITVVLASSLYIAGNPRGAAILALSLCTYTRADL